MQIKETIGVSFPGSVERPPLEDVAINLGVFVGHGWLMAAIVAGLAIGKPLGVFLAAAAVVRAGIAVKPAEYSWRQLAGAGALAGIGFTMSLFIAGQAFPSATDFSAAKIAVFAASNLSAVSGLLCSGELRARSYRGGAAERQHASIIARRCLCGP